MKAAFFTLPAFCLLFAASALIAQEPIRRTAAEQLEIEQANRKSSIAATPVDEKLSSLTETAHPAPAIPAETPSPNLRKSAQEKAAAEPDRNRRIPEPPLDELSEHKTLLPLLPLLPAAQETAKPAQPFANPDEREMQQHKRNDIRHIPPAPKDESNSNQH